MENSNSETANHLDVGSIPERVKLSPLRKAIAVRMTEAKRSIPHFRVLADIEMDEVLTLRKEINAQRTDIKVSVNDFIVKALADADFFKRIDLRDRAIKIFKQREAISVLSLMKRQSFLWHQTSGFIRSLGENIYNETKVRTSMNEAHLILKKFEPLDVTSETIQEVFTYNIIQFDNVLDDAIDRNDQFSQQLSEAVKKDCSAPIIKNNKKIADLAQTIDEYISGTYGPRADLYGDIDAFQSDFFELIGIKG